MERSLRIKTIILLALVLVSSVYLVPTFFSAERLPPWFTRVFDKRVKLGLDLQGGLHIVYRVDLDKVIDDTAGEKKRDIEAKLAEQKIEAIVETPRPNPAARIPLGAVIVVPKDEANGKKIDDKFLDDYAEMLVKSECPEGKQGAICLRVATDYAEKMKVSALEQAIKTIKERVDKTGVADPTIVKKGEDIVVELPGTDDKENEHIRGIINRTAQLEFKMVDDGTEYMRKLADHVSKDPAAKEKITVGVDQWTNETTGAEHQDYYLQAKDVKEHITREKAQAIGCPTKDKFPDADGKFECVVSGRTIMEEYLAGVPKELQPDDEHQMQFEEISRGDQLDPTKAVEKRWRSYYLHRTAELTGTAISDTRIFNDPTTYQPEVEVTFNRYGARRFGEMSSKNVGRKMAIILDEKITSAPEFRTAIPGGKALITLGRGRNARDMQREAEDLVAVLRTGALPAPLVESQSSQVGALLGQDAIDKAQMSMGVGGLLVILLMLYFYKFSGVIANVAMVLNVLFQVAVLAMFQATLTLPGIAGLVLTIGMAVDSNIIIYERIREELRAGKSIRGAVDAGFSRAFWTVFDAHVTNFVAGFVLMEYGTGPIRGFAVTLLIGVVCNLFTSTWVSRLFFDHYITRRRNATAMISI
ncbi:MAG TPA: protein translocase subunit SecD [Haliangiales bacterium]|nr:protein translocase subunit SecD [Haliangiales bacterium]